MAVNLKWNWNEVESKKSEEHKRLTPGGFVCKITKAENNPDREYIYLEFDIAEGEFSGYGADCMERNGFTPLKMYRSYTTKAAGMFKGFIETLNESNPTAPAWDGDENKLVGKFIGIILGEEEYRKRDGNIGVRLNAVRTVTPARIRSGNFSVPQKKTLPAEQTSAFTAIESVDAELPF